jgi:hypothetical protein
MSTYQDIKPKLMMGIKSLYRTGYNIIIVGHSLGGALGNILAVDLSREYLDAKVVLYSYGAPKVGKAEFCKIFADCGIDHYRIVNNADCVPRLPRSYMFFQHTGKEILLGKKGFWWFGSSEDHAISQYLRNTPEDL